MTRDEDEDTPASVRSFARVIEHRGGTRIEVGEPIKVPGAGPGEQPWLCAAKLMGKNSPAEGREHTLLMQTGRGNTPYEAQQEAIAQLSLLVGTPSAPPPQVVITGAVSEPPASEPSAPGASSSTPPGWWAKLRRLVSL